LGGRSAVKSVTKQYGKRLGDAEEAYRQAVHNYNRAPDNASFPQEIIDKLKDTMGKARGTYKGLRESPPNISLHRNVGRVGGGLLGGLPGAGLGTLGGLALNKPQPWEE
jgi:hypothetical protein